jgi:hypothetical protein
MAAGDQGALSVLGKVQSCTVDFAEKLRHELSSAADEDVASVLETVFATLDSGPGKRCDPLYRTSAASRSYANVMPLWNKRGGVGLPTTAPMGTCEQTRQRVWMQGFAGECQMKGRG